MEERLSELEDFAVLSMRLHRMAEEGRQRFLVHQQQAEEFQRQTEEFQQQTEEFQLRSAEFHRRSAQYHLQASERLTRLEGDQDQIQEILSRMTQAVALIQADIVRLDETR